MERRRILGALVSLLWAGAVQAAFATAPASQPAEERARQRLLPQSDDPIWITLAHSKITSDMNKGVFLASHPADVRALEGKTVTMRGFMLQTLPMGPYSNFILSRYTPVCAFCPPGAPNEAVEVNLAGFTGQTSGAVAVTGRMHVADDANQGLFFTLEGARIASN